MADSKITALGSIGTGTDPANDQLVIVDVSDVLPTGMATTGTTKRVGLNQLLSSSPTATGAFSVTGLVTAGSATITGDLTVDTSTLKVDSTNDRVGIGTASPAFRLHVNAGNGNQLVLSNAGEQFTLIEYRNSSTVKAQQFWDNTNSIFENYINTTGAFTWKQTATELMRLNSTGNLVLKGGTAAATGVGVTFPATQVASSDANCLDDYEEGTWTIGLTFGGASTGITTSANQGKYTKIGRQVTVTGFLGLTNKGSATGAALITGIPFATGTSTESYSAASLMLSAVTFADFPVAFALSNSTNINLQETTNAGVKSNLTDADFANSSEIVLSFTYTV